MAQLRPERGLEPGVDEGPVCDLGCGTIVAPGSLFGGLCCSHLVSMLNARILAHCIPSIPTTRLGDNTLTRGPQLYMLSAVQGCKTSTSEDCGPPAPGLGWLPWSDPMILTHVTLPPAQLLEPLQGHCPGEDPTGCIWHKFSHNDLGYPVVKVPPLPALGNPVVPGAFACSHTFFLVVGRRIKEGCTIIC